MPIKPILFNTEMVRAILDSRKTATRRVVKPQADSQDNVYVGDGPKGFGAYFYDVNYPEEGTTFIPAPCKPGDILWVRETWAEVGGHYFYKSGHELLLDGEPFIKKWHPSIHMPREAARISLRVTAVRVERLQEINGHDILAEGVDNGRSNPLMGIRWENQQRMAFCDLWNSTIKKADLSLYGWEANPWVWVIEFKRTEGGQEE